MAIQIPGFPGSSAQALQTNNGTMQNVLHPIYYRFLSQLLTLLSGRVSASQMIVKAGAPAVADVPDGEFRIIKNTTGPTYSLVVNDGGTLKSVALT